MRGGGGWCVGVGVVVVWVCGGGVGVWWWCAGVYGERVHMWRVHMYVLCAVGGVVLCVCVCV